MTQPLALRYAVHGPMFSGKTTLSKLLRDAGFTYVNYTDYGKTLIARSLTALLGREVTQEEVIARKNEWRGYIITGLRIYGFDEGRGVEDLIRDLPATTPIVFDNVRYLSQYEALKPYGFTLVRLVVSPHEQENRAIRAGMSRDELLRLREESSEQPVPEQPGEITICTDENSPLRLFYSLMELAGIVAQPPV